MQLGPIRRASAPLAWAACALCAAMAIAALVVARGNYPSAAAYASGVGPGALLALSFPLVGALVATHRARNPLGLVFVTVGLSEGLVTLAGEYGALAAVGHAPGAWSAWSRRPWSRAGCRSGCGRASRQRGRPAG
jgi:hypothetical protein